MPKLWIIEKRNEDGSLDLSQPQPLDFFGMSAIHGMDDWALSRFIYARFPEAVLCGDSIAKWPQYFDKHFIARQKTW